MMTKKQCIGGLATAAILAVVGSITAVAPALARDGEKGIGAENRLQQGDEWMQMRLKRMADRLEIKASQQSAWQEYVTAAKAASEGRRSAPPTGADAASVVRARAAHATEFAAKLTKLADATAQLEQVLTPAQRQTLDQMSEPGRHHGDHCGPGPGGDHDHAAGHPREHGGPGM